MEYFDPGTEFGYEYRHFIWVCTNPVSRSFDKCASPEDQEVLEALRRRLQEHNLARETFVFTSAEADFSAGCMLGCHREGTTVAVFSRAHQGAAQGHMRFYRKVLPKDVDLLIQVLLVSP